MTVAWNNFRSFCPFFVLLFEVICVFSSKPKYMRMVSVKSENVFFLQDFRRNAIFQFFYAQLKNIVSIVSKLMMSDPWLSMQMCPFFNWTPFSSGLAWTLEILKCFLAVPVVHWKSQIIVDFWLMVGKWSVETKNAFLGSSYCCDIGC